METHWCQECGNLVEIYAYHNLCSIAALSPGAKGKSIDIDSKKCYDNDSYFEEICNVLDRIKLPIDCANNPEGIFMWVNYYKAKCERPISISDLISIDSTDDKRFEENINRLWYKQRLIYFNIKHAIKDLAFYRTRTMWSSYCLADAFELNEKCMCSLPRLVPYKIPESTLPYKIPESTLSCKTSENYEYNADESESWDHSFVLHAIFPVHGNRSDDEIFTLIDISILFPEIRHCLENAIAKLKKNILFFTPLDNDTINVIVNYLPLSLKIIQ